MMHRLPGQHWSRLILNYATEHHFRETVQVAVLYHHHGSDLKSTISRIVLDFVSSDIIINRAGHADMISII